MKDQVKIGLIQEQAEIGMIQENLDKIAKAAEDARRNDADIICFGEGFVQGYVCTEEATKFAETIPGPAADRLAAISRESGLLIVTGFLERLNDALHNCAVLVDDKGSISVYRKTFLGPHEKPTFSRGRGRVVWESRLGKIGMMICYDAFFPEVSRELAEMGAELVFCVSATALSEKEFGIFLPARAAENRFYLSFANLVGWRAQLNAPYFGASRIVMPDGTVILTAERFISQTVYGTIDNKFLRYAREERPLLAEIHEQWLKTSTSHSVSSVGK